MTSLPTDIGTWLDTAAHDLDTTSDNAAALLPELGRAGLFRIGVSASLGGSGGDVTDAVAAIAAVSERSLSAGFVFWGHRAFIEYLLQSPNELLRSKLLPGLLAGHRAGATGLSNAMKFLSGIEELQVKARKSNSAIRINGQLPWVTNLQSSGFDVAAAVQGDDGNPAFVASLSSDDHGLERLPDLDLMAMRATSTAAIKIDDVRIGPERILHRNAHEWLPKVRPAFLGLQCAMAIGLARRSLAETKSKLNTVRDVLTTSVGDLAADLTIAEMQLRTGLLNSQFVEAPAPLFRLRIRLAEIAAEAVQLELSASGGKAYLSEPGKDFQRRLREVAFVPIITPSLVQLKTALAVHEQPKVISEIA